MFFRSVPEKVLVGMQWASNLPSHWLYSSIDDDIAVNFERLHKYYSQLMHEHTLPSGEIQFSKVPVACVYSYQDKDIPARDPKSKWYMPEKDFPGKYWPVYCRGGMYSTSSYMVKKLFKVSRRTQRLYLDDVWITGFMRLKVEDTDNNIVVSSFCFLEISRCLLTDPIYIWFDSGYFTSFIEHSKI